jgi:hypothetical protein
MEISDPRFLRQLSRRFCGRPARYLEGCGIYLVDDSAGLEIHVTNGLNALIGLEWRNHEAFVISGHTVPGILSEGIDDLEEALTDFLRLFLRKHRLIDSKGFSTRKDIA